MHRFRFAANMQSVNRPRSEETMSAWSLQMLLLIGSGIVASAQIGKAIISVPLIRNELFVGLIADAATVVREPVIEGHEYLAEV